MVSLGHSRTNRYQNGWWDTTRLTLPGNRSISYTWWLAGGGALGPSMVLLLSVCLGYRKFHSLVCRLLCGHVCIGDMWPPQWQYHGVQDRSHVPYWLWTYSWQRSNVWVYQTWSCSVCSHSWHGVCYQCWWQAVCSLPEVHRFVLHCIQWTEETLTRAAKCSITGNTDMCAITA